MSESRTDKDLKSKIEEFFTKFLYRLSLGEEFLAKQVCLRKHSVLRCAVDVVFVQCVY